MHVSGPPDPIDIIQDLPPRFTLHYPTRYHALCCETIRFRMDSTIYLKPSVMEYWMQHKLRICFSRRCDGAFPDWSGTTSVQHDTGV